MQTLLYLIQVAVGQVSAPKFTGGAKTSRYSLRDPFESRQQSWVCNTAKVDYFGEVVAHPEWVLEDLAALVQSDVEGPHGVFEKLERPSRQP